MFLSALDFDSIFSMKLSAVILVLYRKHLPHLHYNTSIGYRNIQKKRAKEQNKEYKKNTVRNKRNNYY